MLVTDYSSVMFDYAVLDRPIVIYASDWDEYRTLRGTYFDLLAEPPGRGGDAPRRSWPRCCVTGGRGTMSRPRCRQAFRARFCSLEDGRAAERVVRRLWPRPRGGTR